jgi:hypothetical protein
MAAGLKRHPRRTVRELIALLDKKFRWKTTESAVTGHLYTLRDKFVHTPPVARPIVRSPGLRSRAGTRGTRQNTGSLPRPASERGGKFAPAAAGAIGR